MANGFQNRIGVTAEERVINSFNLTPSGGIKNIGLLVERERGVDGKIILVNNIKEDRRIFGGHNANMYSSFVVETLFNNTGGYPVNVFQARIVGDGSLPAKTVVKNASQDLQTITRTTTQNYNSSPVTSQIDELQITNVEAGDTFTVTLSANSGTAINETFSHTATGTSADTVANELVTAINAQMTTLGADLVAANVSNGKFTITGASFAFTTTTSATNEATSEPIFNLIAGYQGEADKGTWGNSLRVRVYPIGHINGSTDGYKLEVFYKGYLVETFISGGDDWADLLTQVNQRSGYVMMEQVDFTKALTLSPFDSALIGGVYVAPVEADFNPRYNEVTQEPLGMNLFEGEDVQVVACPEVFSSHFAKLCEDFARKNLKFFIFNMPYLATESVLETYYNALFTPDQSFSASCLNWIEVPMDMEGNKIWVPSIGYILGAGYVRKPAMHNGYIWIPPAGTETTAKGVYRTTHDGLSEDTLSRYVKKWRCNVVKFIKNIGFCIWSSRTYSNNALFESIHVRLETNWIIENLLVRNQKALQSLISPSTLRSIKTDNLIWFKNLYETGGIEQSVPFDEAVIINVEQLKEARKEVEVEISWIPPECLEHIHLKLNRNDGILILNFKN